MLEKFKKLMGSEEPKPEAATTTLAVTLDATALQAELGEMKAQFEAVANAFAEANEKLASMSADLEAAKAALAAVEGDKAEMIAQAAAAKLAVRKDKVVAAIGTEKADGLMAATENLDDAAFEAVVSALAGSVEVEANSSLFKEQGVDAQVDAAKVEEESEEKRLLKQKYSGAK